MPNPRAQRPLTLDRAVEDIKSFQVPARALADMMAGALRGSTAATLGLPGDIENLGRGALAAARAPSGQRLNAFASGMEQPTVLPTTERMMATLPKATPVATPYEELGQFAPLPGSATAAKALSYGAGRAAGAGTRAVGQAISDAMIHQAGPLSKGPLSALAPRAAMTNVVKPHANSLLERVAPNHEAMLLAQRRAALPVSEGGLGLPPNNTPEQRAKAMGFDTDTYHGSVYDINKFDPRMASTESHAGKGVYSTDSPEDASRNYASIYGPDVSAKVERGMENRDKDWRKIHRRMKDETLTPRQQEAILQNTINAHNLGVVYPLKVRSNKSIHLDEPHAGEAMVGPFQHYDEATDVWSDSPHTEKFNEALDEFRQLGGDANPIYETVQDYNEPMPARELFNAVKREGDQSGLYDPYTGDIVSGGVAAGDFVKHFGVDEIRHTPSFRNHELNIGGEHTISLDPDNVRSRFAAFDPWRKNAAIAAAMGVAAPDLLAKEKKAEGGEVGMNAGGSTPKPPDAEMREKLRQLRDSFVPLANEFERQKKIQDNLEKMNKKVSFSDNPDSMMMDVEEAQMAGGGDVRGYDKGGSIKATPRSEGWGMAADIAKAIEDASKEQFGYKNPATEVIADLLGIPAVARTLERKAYGKPITNIGKANVPLLPDDTAETLMTVAPLAKPAAKGAKAAGKLAASEIEKAMFGESSSKLLNEITPQVMAAAPARLARAPAKTKEEIRAVAERIAPQVTGEYVRKGPTKAETIAGKTQKQFEREKDLPVDIRPTGEARTPQKIDIESLKGSTFMGIPGDYTVTGKTLHGVGDVKLDMPSPQHGGPLYGLYHDDAHFWASEKDRAATAQNLARTISQQYESPVIGNYIMMGPEGMNYAQHFADANLQAIDLSKMSKRDIEKLNKAIREGSVESGRRDAFPGIEDKGSAYLWFSQDPALRKHFNQIMQKESIAKLAGLPSGYDVRFAVTEPELRDLERGVTGFSMGQMRPDIPAEGLRFSEHPTYSHDIPGHFLGQSKYPIPYELSFPDTVKAIRENPRQAPHEFGTLQYIGARQPIDQQLIDEIKQYEEMMKSLTGKKKGGSVHMAEGGELSFDLAQLGLDREEKTPYERMSDVVQNGLDSMFPARKIGRLAIEAKNAELQDQYKKHWPLLDDAQKIADQDASLAILHNINAIRKKIGMEPIQPKVRINTGIWTPEFKKAAGGEITAEDLDIEERPL